MEKRGIFLFLVVLLLLLSSYIGSFGRDKITGEFFSEEIIIEEIEATYTVQPVLIEDLVERVVQDIMFGPGIFDELLEVPKEEVQPDAPIMALKPTEPVTYQPDSGKQPTIVIRRPQEGDVFEQPSVKEEVEVIRDFIEEEVDATYVHLGKGCTNAFYIDEDCDGYGVASPLGPDADDSDSDVNTAATFEAKWNSQWGDSYMEEFIKYKFKDDVDELYGTANYEPNEIYYVDKEKGNAAWDGKCPVKEATSNCGPKQSFDDTLRGAFQPGDVLIYRGGNVRATTVDDSYVYPGFNSRRPWSYYEFISGTKEKPILFMTYPGEFVTMHRFSYPSMGNGDSDYIMFDGFIIEWLEAGHGHIGFEVGGTEGVLIEGVLIRNIESMNFDWGIWGPGEPVKKDVLIDHNVLHDNPDEHGLYLVSYIVEGHERITIRDSLFYRNGRNGIQLNGPFVDTVVENNIIHTNEIAGIQIKNGVKNSIFRNNLIFNNNHQGIVLHTYNEVYSPPAALQSLNYNIFENNLIWVGEERNGVGSSESRPADLSAIKLVDGLGHTFIGNEFRNNILIDSGRPVFYIVDGKHIPQTLFENNLFYTYNPGSTQDGNGPVLVSCDPDSPATYYRSSPASYCDANYYWDLETVQTPGHKWSSIFKNNIMEEPKLMDVSPTYNLNPEKFNFYYLTNSPAINLGIKSATTPLYDLKGNLRDVNIDAGCYEYVGQQFDFSVAVNPTRGRLEQGQSITPEPKVDVSLVSGTGQSVSLSVSVMPPTGGNANDITITFSPQSCTPDCSSDMGISVSSTAAVGRYGINIEGKSGSLVKNAQYVLTVKEHGGKSPPVLDSLVPSFVYNDEPSMVELRGSNFDVGAKVEVNGVEYTGPVQRVDDKLIVIGILQGVPLGFYNIRVVNSDGQRSNELILEVRERVMKPAPILTEIRPNVIYNDKENIVQLIGIGFTDLVALEVTAGTSSIIYPIELTKRISSNLIEMTIPANSAMGIYNIAVINSDLQKSNSLPLIIREPVQQFDFSLSLNPSSGTFQQGAIVSTVVDVTLLNGVTEPVDLSTTVLPPPGGSAEDLTLTLSTTLCSPDCNSNLDIVIADSAVPGIYDITITGKSKETSVLDVVKEAHYYLTVQLRGVRNPPVLSSIVPNIIYNDKQNIVELHGSNFAEQAVIKVVAGSTTSYYPFDLVEYVSSELIRMTILAGSATGRYFISVINVEEPPQESNLLPLEIKERIVKGGKIVEIFKDLKFEKGLITDINPTPKSEWCEMPTKDGVKPEWRLLEHSNTNLFCKNLPNPKSIDPIVLFESASKEKRFTSYKDGRINLEYNTMNEPNNGCYLKPQVGPETYWPHFGVAQSFYLVNRILYEEDGVVLDFIDFDKLNFNVDMKLNELKSLISNQDCRKYGAYIDKRAVIGIVFFLHHFDPNTKDPNPFWIMLLPCDTKDYGVEGCAAGGWGGKGPVLTTDQHGITIYLPGTNEKYPILKKDEWVSYNFDLKELAKEAFDFYNQQKNTNVKYTDYYVKDFDNFGAGEFWGAYDVDIEANDLSLEGIFINTREVCYNEFDDDGDGFVDCEDTECKSELYCADYSKELCESQGFSWTASKCCGDDWKGSDMYSDVGPGNKCCTAGTAVEHDSIGYNKFGELKKYLCYDGQWYAYTDKAFTSVSKSVEQCVVIGSYYANPNYLKEDIFWKEGDGKGISCGLGMVCDGIGSCIEEGYDITLQNSKVDFTFKKNGANFYLDNIKNLNRNIDFPTLNKNMLEFVLRKPTGEKITYSLDTLPYEFSYDLQTLIGRDVLNLYFNNVKIDEQNSLNIKATIELEENSNTADFKINAITDMPSYSLYSITFPIIKFKGLSLDTTKEAFVVPSGMGKILLNPRVNAFKPNPHPGDSSPFVFPSGAIIPNSALQGCQFVSYYNIETNDQLYFATKNYKGYAGNFKYDIEQDGIIFSVLHYPENHLTPNVDYIGQYETTLGALEGDWYDVVQYYRSWASENIAPRGKLEFSNQVSPYLNKLDIYSTFNFDDKIKGQEILNKIQSFKDFFNECPDPQLPDCDPENRFDNYLVELYSWQTDSMHLQLWPEYKPIPLESMELIEQISDKGDLILGYFNSIWFNIESSYYKNNKNLVDSNSLHFENGDLFVGGWYTGGKKEAEFVYPDPTTIFWQDMTKDKMVDLADFGDENILYKDVGFDGFYWDALSGLGTFMDYSDGRNHPKGGGDYWLQGEKQRIKKSKEEFRKVNPNWILVSEYPVEFFVNDLDFIQWNAPPVESDSYFPSIPIFPVLYHDFIGFSTIVGNYDIIGLMRTQSISVEYFTYIWSLYFSFGVWPAVNGDTTYPKFPFEKEELPVYNFMKGLFRSYSYDKKFLKYGQKLRDVEVTVDNVDIKTISSAMPHVYHKNHHPNVPLVMPSVWKANDGSIGIVLINWWKEDKQVSFNFDFTTYGLTSAKTYYLTKLNEKNNEQLGTYSNSFEYTYNVPRYNIVVLSISDIPCPYNNYYYDGDRDGYGNSSIYLQTCSPPSGYVEKRGDCDDKNPSVNPAAREICNNFKDDNCNGLVDCEDPGCSNTPSCRDDDQDGVLNYMDKCPHTISTYRTRVNMRNGCPLPFAAKFNHILTTNFANLEDLHKVRQLRLGITGKGLIEFGDREIRILRFISLTEPGRYDPLDLDTSVDIDTNFIMIDSRELPQLDISADLTLYGLAFKDPVVYRDGSLCKQCKLISYDKEKGDLKFNVPDFSDYEADEGSCGDGICSLGESCSSCSKDCGSCPPTGGPGGRGGGGGGRGGTRLTQTINLDVKDNYVVDLSRIGKLYIIFNEKEYSMRFTKMTLDYVTMSFPSINYLLNSLVRQEHRIDLDKDYEADILLKLEAISRRYVATLSFERIKEKKVEPKEEPKKPSPITELKPPEPPKPPIEQLKGGEILSVVLKIVLVVFVILVALLTKFYYLPRRHGRK